MKKLSIYRKLRYLESGGETGAKEGGKMSKIGFVLEIFTPIIKETQLNVC
jgi:hypothetical protein